MSNKHNTATDSNPKQWLKYLAKHSSKWQKLAKLFSILQALMIVFQAWFFSHLLQQVIIEKQSANTLFTLCFFTAITTLLRYVFSWCREACGVKSSLTAQQRLRRELIDQLFELGPAWRNQKRGGELVSQLQEQVANIDGYIAKYLPQMGLVMTVPLFILIAVAQVSWAATLIFLATAPLIPLFMVMVGWKAKDKQVEQQQQLQQMSGHFLDQLRGLTTLQLFNRHRHQTDVITEVSENFRAKTMNVLRIAFLSSAVLEFFASISIALIAVYLGFSFLGYFNFGLYGQSLTLANAFFILLLAPEFYLPLRDLGSHYHAKAEAEAAAEQLMPLLNEKTKQVTGGDKTPNKEAVAITFDAIDFAYTQGTPIFTQANLNLVAGKTTALIGESGSGKTTVLRLILGQLAPQAGQIIVADSPLNKMNMAAWRGDIGWMSQQPHLLAASLRDNLQIANENASDDEMLKALQTVELKDWVLQLPDVLDTLLGENGRQLSGGQLRRLALARVILSNANIILFDEPTASLDEDLEQQLLAPMRELCHGKTVLLLTHRQAPLTLADTVIKIENGGFVNG